MSDPLGIQNLFLGTMSGAVVVLSGAFYALFFALGRLNRSYSLSLAALVAYVLLVVAVCTLVVALDLNGVWMGVAAAMLIGYFLAPRAIWRLCVGTHGDEEADIKNGAT